MFLIVAKWVDNSDSIFLVGRDPANPKLPNWADVFTKLDTIGDPAEAKVQYAKVSRDFVLLRDEETLEFSLDDSIAGNRLRPMKMAEDASMRWYETLLQSGESANDENDDISDENGDRDDEPEF
jgi:hypothetical protein